MGLSDIFQGISRSCEENRLKLEGDTTESLQHIFYFDIQ